MSKRGFGFNQIRSYLRTYAPFSRALRLLLVWMAGSFVHSVTCFPSQLVVTQSATVFGLEGIISGNHALRLYYAYRMKEKTPCMHAGSE